MALSGFKGGIAFKRFVEKRRSERFSGCGVKANTAVAAQRLRLVFSLTCLTHKSRRTTELFGHRDNVEGKRHSSRRLHAANVRPSA